MPPSKTKLSEALRAWVEVYMSRSMRDTMRYWKDAGLNLTQVSTLMRLHYHGQCGVSQVGSQLGITNAAASQMVEKLVQAGYLARAEDPADRRARQLTLTKKGRALVAGSIEARRRWLDDLAATIAPADQPRIAEALQQLTEAAQAFDSRQN